MYICVCMYIMFVYVYICVYVYTHKISHRREGEGYEGIATLMNDVVTPSL